MGMVKDQWLPVVGIGNGQSTEGFYGSENTLHGIIMMKTCHYRFIQTHRMYYTKGDS